jgi:hypothetical protein
MSRGVYHRRVDENHLEIVHALRRVFGEHSTVSTATIGKGFPDAICGAYGLNILFEIKKPGGKLRPDQEKFHPHWRGQLCVVETAEQAICAVIEEARRKCGPGADLVFAGLLAPGRFVRLKNAVEFREE